MSDRAAHFRDELRRLRLARGLTFQALGERANYSRTYVEDLEKGRKPRGDTPPRAEVVERLDDALGAGGRLRATLRAPSDQDLDAEIEAMELTRRVTASDVSPETLERLEQAVDRMAMAYATTPPEQLLPRVRQRVHGRRAATHDVAGGVRDHHPGRRRTGRRP